jgi:hypothetical protein
MCKAAVQQQEIGVFEGRNLGGFMQDMGQRAIGRRNFFCITKIPELLNVYNSNSHLSTIS